MRSVPSSASLARARHALVPTLFVLSVAWFPLAGCRDVLGIHAGALRSDARVSQLCDAATCVGPNDAMPPDAAGRGVQSDASDAAVGGDHPCQDGTWECDDSDLRARATCRDGAWQPASACALGFLCERSAPSACKPDDDKLLCAAASCAEGGRVAAGSGGSAGVSASGAGGGSGTAGAADGGGSGSAGASGSGAADGGGGTQAEAGTGGAAGAPPTGDPCSTPNATQCMSVAAVKRKHCDAATLQWIEETPCTTGQACDRNDGSCEPIVPVCLGRTPGDIVCDGADRHTCGPDLVTSVAVSCASAAHCQQAQGPACATCIDGEHTCMGAMLLTCNATHDGFASPVSCASPALCNAEAGQCTSAACVANQHQCVGDELSVCNPAQTGFSNEQACAAGLCDGPNGQCDICNHDSCVSASQRGSCSADGQTVTPLACPSDKPICIGNGNCIQCTAASDCAATTCMTASCDANTCNSQAASAGTGCGSSGVCNGSGVCGVCVPIGPGALRCMGAQPQHCDGSGQWANAAACTSDQLCRAGACVANAAYTAGYPNALSMTSQFGTTTIYGISFQASAAARVLGIGLQARDDSGRLIIMGIYDSAGSAPGKLLGSIPESPVHAGQNEYVPTSVLLLPQAGTYWVTAALNGVQDTWIDFGAAGASILFSTPYGPLPATFPSGGTVNTVLRNLFVRLQNTQ